MQYQSQCGGNLTGMTSFFSTYANGFLAQKRMQYIYSHPSFGDMNYPPGRDCVWNIMGTRKHQNMVLIMDSFEVEYEDKCSYDYLGGFSKLYDLHELE